MEQVRQGMQQRWRRCVAARALEQRFVTLKYSLNSFIPCVHSYPVLSTIHNIQTTILSGNQCQGRDWGCCRDGDITWQPELSTRGLLLSNIPSMFIHTLCSFISCVHSFPVFIHSLCPFIHYVHSYPVFRGMDQKRWRIPVQLMPGSEKVN